MAEKIVAFCGLVCNECPVYKATMADDDKARKEIVKKWSSPEYPLKVEDLNCTGCFGAEDDIFKYCNTCEVRTCGTEKDMPNCAHCDEYTCDKLEKLWKTIGSADAKKTLDDIKGSL